MLEKIKKHKFFHDMEVGGVRTGSWVYGENLPPNYHLFSVFEFLADMDLSNARCLDIGTFDGMTAFVMASLGAQSVEATCQYDLERFRLIHALGGWTNIRYRPKTDLHNVKRDTPSRSFDLICMSAMLHHLISPLDALFVARRLLRHGGYLILESVVRDQAIPSLLLNTEDLDPVYGTPTIWIPSPAALQGMTKLAAFDIVGTCALTGTERARETNYSRLTLLCRAARPSEIRARSLQLTEVQAKSPWPADLDFKQLETEPGEPAAISYAGPTGVRDLDIWCHVPRVPLQPK